MKDAWLESRPVARPGDRVEVNVSGHGWEPAVVEQVNLRWYRPFDSTDCGPVFIEYRVTLERSRQDGRAVRHTIQGRGQRGIRAVT